MSETGNKKESSAKSAPAKKPESKAKDEGGGKKAADAKAKPAAGAASGGGAESGKSARESIGGTGDVHYGYFSSVRTPAYRNGWDAIWGGDGARPPDKRPPKPRKKPRPITLDLDLDDLPAPLKDGLIALARAELKKSRVSYERRDRAGAVDWRIVCRVDR